MGAYHYVVPRMNACLRGEGRQTSGRLAYAGRPPSASTATGERRCALCYSVLMLASFSARPTA